MGRSLASPPPPAPGIVANHPLQSAFRGRTLGLHLPPSPQLPWLHLGGWQLSISGLTASRRTGHQTLELDTGSTSPAPPSSNETGRVLGGSQVPNETLSTVRLEMGPAQG